MKLHIYYLSELFVIINDFFFFYSAKLHKLQKVGH